MDGTDRALQSPLSNSLATQVPGGSRVSPPSASGARLPRLARAPRGIRFAVQLSLLPLPWTVRRVLLNWGFGFDIHPTARIGFSIVDTRRLQMGPGSRIGHFNLFHSLEECAFGDLAAIGKFNWIAGAHSDDRRVYPNSPQRYSRFVVGRSAQIVDGHRIDCADRVEIGPFSVLAGEGSAIFTHGIEIEECEQTCAPVRIGAYALVNARCFFVKGTELADFCVVAAGAVCAFKNSEPYGLYAGVPARRIKDLSKDAAYFSRARGPVD